MTDNPKFQVGDKVAVYGLLGTSYPTFDEILKITPKGQIRLTKFSEKTYNPDGRLRTSKSWERGYIEHDTPELRQRMADEKEDKLLRSFHRDIKWRNLTLPQLRRIKALLDEFDQEATP